jgi:hypothetical protein
MPRARPNFSTLSGQKFTMVVRDFETVAAKPVQYRPIVPTTGERVPVGNAKARDNEPEIDYDRVIWDIDYRRRVVDELNRFYRSGTDRRDGHAAL